MSSAPFFTDPLAEIVGEFDPGPLANGLGITAQQGGDIGRPSVAQLGGLDSRIPPAVLLRERVA